MSFFGSGYRQYTVDRSQVWRRRAHALLRSGNLKGFHSAMSVARSMILAMREGEKCHA